jgi:chromosome partitioning protein
MVRTSQLPAVDRTVHFEQISEFAEKVTIFTNELRDTILAPRPRKTAPVFKTGEIAEMCNISHSQVQYLATKGDGELPPGTAAGTGRTRTFTLEEARIWVQKVSDIYQTSLVTRLKEPDGKIIITAQLKGGSAKTTTTMCLAQGLSLRGRKVLVVDLDPQASLSELCGLYAEKDVTPEDTVLPFVYDQEIEGGLEARVQSTYWDGIDVIPAHTELIGAEFHLPAMQKMKPGFRFWTVLRQGLEPLRKKYDYILMDTSPSLSYMNLNALMAADSMIMPMVPENLDFISSLSFWRLFSDVSKSFIKYDRNSSAPIVRAWAQSAYENWLHSIEVPASSVMSTGALAFSTVFDISSTHSAAKSLQRVRQPLIDYCRWIDEIYSEKWRNAQ